MGYQGLTFCRWLWAVIPRRMAILRASGNTFVRGQVYLSYSRSHLAGMHADTPKAQDMVERVKEKGLAHHHHAFINEDYKHYLQKYPGPRKKLLVLLGNCPF